MSCAQAWEDPSEFHGCGKFAADSWRIFCRGQTGSRGVEDATLKRYLRWHSTGKLVKKPSGARRQAHAKSKSGTRRKAEALPPARVLRSGRRR